MDWCTYRRCRNTDDAYSHVGLPDGYSAGRIVALSRSCLGGNATLGQALMTLLCNLCFDLVSVLRNVGSTVRCAYVPHPASPCRMIMKAGIAQHPGFLFSIFCCSGCLVCGPTLRINLTGVSWTLLRCGARGHRFLRIQFQEP